MWLPIPTTTKRRVQLYMRTKDTKESVMVSQCAKPDCRRELRYLRDGKIYIFAMSTGNGSKSLEHFSLCGECSKKMTLTCLSPSEVRIARRREVTQTTALVMQRFRKAPSAHRVGP